MRIYGGGFLTETELGQLGVGEVGENVRVHDSCILINLEAIAFGSNVRVDAYTILTASTGHLRFGNFVHVGANCFINANANVSLGDFAGLSQGVRIYSTSDDYSGRYLTNPTIPREFQHMRRAAVCLGRHVIVGSGSVILPGANIAEGSSIGALSVVTRPLEGWGIYAGQPARRVRERDKQLLEEEARLLSSMAGRV